MDIYTIPDDIVQTIIFPYFQLNEIYDIEDVTNIKYKYLEKEFIRRINKRFDEFQLDNFSEIMRKNKLILAGPLLLRQFFGKDTTIIDKRNIILFQIGSESQDSPSHLELYLNKFQRNKVYGLHNYYRYTSITINSRRLTKKNDIILVILNPLFFYKVGINNKPNFLNKLSISEYFKETFIDQSHTIFYDGTSIHFPNRNIIQNVNYFEHPKKYINNINKLFHMYKLPIKEIGDTKLPNIVKPNKISSYIKFIGISLSVLFVGITIIKSITFLT